MKRGFGRGRGGGGWSRGNDSLNRTSSSTWDTSSWGIPEQSPGGAGRSSGREQDSGWGGRRPRDRGSSTANEETGGSSDWGVVKSRVEPDGGGWGDVHGSRPDAPGWTLDKPVADKGGSSSAGGWKIPGEEKKVASDSQSGNPAEGGGGGAWGSPKKPASDIGDWGGGSSWRDPDTTTDKKSNLDWSSKPSRSAAEFQFREEEPSRGAPDHSRQSKPSTRASQPDVSASQDDHQQTVDWSHVQHSRRPGARRESFSGTDPSINTTQLISKLNLPSSVVNTSDKWYQLIGLFAHAVIMELELRKATGERDRFKKAQSSASYSRVGLAGRNKLDRVRADLEKTLAEKKKQYSDTVKVLAKFHEVPRLAFLLGPQKLEEEARSYTAEAKDWITTIRPTLIANFSNIPPPVSPPSPPLSEPTTHANGMMSKGTKRIKLTTPAIEELDQPRSTFVTRVHEIEDRIDKLQGDMLLSNYTTIRDSVDEKIEARFSALALSADPKAASAIGRSSQEEGECTPDPLPLPTSASQVVKFAQKTEVLGSNMSEQAKKTAEVLTEVHLHEEELKRIRAENEQLKQNHAALLDRLAQCEQFREQSIQEVRELSAMLQNACEPRPLPPEMLIKPKIPREELLEEVTSFVRTLVEQTIDPLISTVHEKCKNDVTMYKETIYQEFWTKVSGPLKMSEAISLILDAKGIN